MKNLNEQPNNEPKLSLRERLEQWKQYSFPYSPLSHLFRKRNKETPRKPLPNPDKPLKFEEMLRDNKPIANQPKSTMKRLSSQSPSCTTSVRKLSDASDLDHMPFSLNPKLSESHRKDLERTLSFSSLAKTSQTPKRFQAPNTSFFTRSITMGDSRPGTCQKLSHKEDNFKLSAKGSANKGSLFSKDPFKGLDLNRSLSLRNNNRKTPLREVKRMHFNEPAPVSKFDISEEIFWERKPVQMEKEVDQFKMLCEDEEDVKRFESFLPEDTHLEVELQTPRKLPEAPAAISMEKPRGNVAEFLWSSNIELEEDPVEEREPVKSEEPIESTEPTEPRESIEPAIMQEQEAVIMENNEENEQNFVIEDTKMNEEIEEISEETNREVNEETHINEEIPEKEHPEINEEVNEIVNTEVNEDVHPEVTKEMNEEEIHEEVIEEPIEIAQDKEQEVIKEAEIVDTIAEPAEEEEEVKLDHEREQEELIEEGLTNTRENSSNLIFEPSNDGIEFGQEANKGSSRTASTTPVKHIENFETSSSLNNEEKMAQNNENENENDEKSSLPINLELTQDHKENNEEEIIINATELNNKEEQITLNTTTILETKEQEEALPATAMLEEKDDTETIQLPQEIPQYIPSIYPEPEPIPQENLEKSPVKVLQKAPIEEEKPLEIAPQMSKSMAKSMTKKRKRTELEVLFEQASAFHGKESLKKVHLTTNNGRERAFATPHEKIKIELPARSKAKASTNKKIVNESPAPAVSATKMVRFLTII